MKIIVEVKNGDIFEVRDDILALKYAQLFYRTDGEVAERLAKFHQNLLSTLPKPGECRFYETYGSLSVKAVLFVGVNDLADFGYPQIREFARRALEYLGQVAPGTKNLCLTLHGAGYGLDELEAFESEIAGCIDAVASGRYPQSLERIAIVEIRPDRTERLRKVLAGLLPDGAINVDARGLLAGISETTTERIRSAGYASGSKPFVFVAMPFDEKMDDVFHYGIQGAVNSAGYLCERADMSSFTGDIMDWVKKRIRNASFLVADLTNANPNVYLEVGYAWGCGIPTVLLVQDTTELKFDVKSQRCIVYKKIKDLEEKLRKELENLKL
ncbi:MAG: hypothetical protein FJ009_16315 [Chloroflexi bacterium]|nr:hypothetical protein [Chloroflexota bacterium]